MAKTPLQWTIRTRYIKDERSYDNDNKFLPDLELDPISPPSTHFPLLSLPDWI